MVEAEVSAVHTQACPLATCISSVPNMLHVYTVATHQWRYLVWFERLEVTSPSWPYPQDLIAPPLHPATSLTQPEPETGSYDNI